MLDHHQERKISDMSFDVLWDKSKGDCVHIRFEDGRLAWIRLSEEQRRVLWRLREEALLSLGATLINWTQQAPGLKDTKHG